MTTTAQAERNSLRVMGLAGFASMASMRLCDPMLLVLGQEFSVAIGEASQVVSVLPWCTGRCSCFMGRWLTVLANCASSLWRCWPAPCSAPSPA